MRVVDCEIRKRSSRVRALQANLDDMFALIPVYAQFRNRPQPERPDHAGVIDRPSIA